MINLDLIFELISPITVIACLCLGYVIKRAFKNKTVNAFIPCLLACVGMAANVWASGAVNLQIITAGAVSGLAATGLYEGFSNILNLPKVETEENDTIEIPYGEGRHFN